MKTYSFRGYGNFSGDFGWDEGINLSEPLEVEDKFEEDPIKFMGKYVKEVYFNEHNGYRDIELLVQAYDKVDAAAYAQIYCDYFYPDYEY